MFPAKRRVHSQVRKKYNELSLVAVGKYADKLKSYKDSNSIINNYLNDFITVTDCINKEIVKDFVSVECYTIDEEAIGRICSEKGYLNPALNALAEYNNAFESLYQKRNIAISNNNQARNQLASSTESAAFRSAIVNNSNSRHNAYLYTSGLGTAFAYAKATSANNAVNKQFQQELDAFFKSHVYRQKLINGISASANNLGNIILEDSKYQDVITSEASSKARALFNNFNIIPEEKAREVSLEILQLDPYQSEYYIAFVKKYLKNSKEIIAIANYLGVDLAEGLGTIVKNVAIANMGSSFDDIKEC
ncbi:hypothetical protein SAMN02910353_01614 [Ruminococcus sp. YRD2003]|uniref:hypothetical protein n=1 Tax=Ruminococcus sp. YRD2003 TaxID=1452313 RepID=UPI0008C1614E|nr:hypothetical protein SAMN02910353_01614 [Ruminococcus flavefaciens]